MTFSDLQLALARLASDPRVHPNTRVEVAYQTHHEIDGLDGLAKDEWIDDDQAPLVAISLRNHTLLLSVEAEEDAVVR